MQNVTALKPVGERTKFERSTPPAPKLTVGFTEIKAFKNTEGKMFATKVQVIDSELERIGNHIKKHYGENLTRGMIIYGKEISQLMADRADALIKDGKEGWGEASLDVVKTFTDDSVK